MNPLLSLKYCYFFFFKQKTAYEMRISDWSSDVCSSDLGYRLLAAWRGNEAVALAGYRGMEMLIHGKFIYVDDLITREDARGKRLGEQLLAHLYGMAWEQGCSRVMLDTGIANGLAQRFY